MKPSTAKEFSKEKRQADKLESGYIITMSRFEPSATEHSSKPTGVYKLTR